MNAQAIAGAAAAALLFMGCGGHDHHESGHTHEAGEEHGEHDETARAHGVEFKEGEGLFIPPRTRDLLGLKIVEAQSGASGRKLELPLRVFRIAESGGERFALASGVLDTNKITLLRPGTKIELREPRSAEKFEGTITEVEPGSAKLIGLGEVIVTVPKTNGLELGTFLQGTVTANRADALLLPAEALLKTTEGYFVYVIQGERIVRSKVGVGDVGEETAEITEGLQTGDRVVAQPVMALRMAELQAIRGGGDSHGH